MDSRIRCATGRQSFPHLALISNERPAIAIGKLHGLVHPHLYRAAPVGSKRANQHASTRHNVGLPIVNGFIHKHAEPHANFVAHRHNPTNTHSLALADANRIARAANIHKHIRAREYFHTVAHAAPNSMRKSFELLLITTLLIAGCAANAPANEPSLFALVTIAPNASPTPTPFQPIPWTQTSSLPSQLLSDSPASTSTPPPPTPALTNTATLDPNFLINTVAPLPTFESQVLNNGQDTVNFLLIGSDRRSTAGSTRTDTMVVAIVGVSTGYPGGGPALLKETIQYNLGIRIDHTAMVDFDGFRKIVDTLGGVDVPVSCAYTDWKLIDPSYDPEIEANWYLHTVEPGVLHMDGDLALWYARSRQKSSDFDRGRRQQEVIRALFTQALQAGTLTRIPELYNNLKDSVETDLGLGDILQLSVYAPKMTNADIRSYYIRPPIVNSWITDGGAYVLSPNQELLQQMLAEALSPSARPAERQAIVIDVMNGTSIPGYETLAATRLNYAGYETRIIPSERQDYAYSVLIDKTAVQDRNFSNPILAVMGMLPGSLISAPDPNSASHYLLILGNDYQPCFSPEKMTQ